MSSFGPTARETPLHLLGIQALRRTLQGVQHLRDGHLMPGTGGLRRYLAQVRLADLLSHRDSWLRGLDADAGINDLAPLARRQSKDGVEVEFSDFRDFFNQERDA